MFGDKRDVDRDSPGVVDEVRRKRAEGITISGNREGRQNSVARGREECARRSWVAFVWGKHEDHNLAFRKTGNKFGPVPRPPRSPWG